MLHSTYGAKGQRPDEQRMAELLLYIASRSTEDDYFGLTKLNKLLFYSDLQAYLKRGQSITGYPYLKFRQGPVAEDLPLLQERMVASGDLRIEARQFFNLLQQRPVATRDPDLDAFHPGEIEIVHSVLDLFADYSAKDISDFSHQFEGWKLAEERERIPYAVAFIDTDPELSGRDLAVAQELADELAAEAT